MDQDTVERMMAVSNLSDDGHAAIEASPAAVEEARNEAVAIALATSESRQTVEDLVDASHADRQGTLCRAVPGRDRERGILADRSGREVSRPHGTVRVHPRRSRPGPSPPAHVRAKRRHLRGVRRSRGDRSVARAASSERRACLARRNGDIPSPTAAPACGTTTKPFWRPSETIRAARPCATTWWASFTRCLTGW